MNSQGSFGYFRNFVNEQLYQFNNNNKDDEQNKENDENTK